jgi:hypothetical protein
MIMDEQCELKNILESDMLAPETDLADINMDKIRPRVVPYPAFSQLIRRPP